MIGGEMLEQATLQEGGADYMDDSTRLASRLL
jgi:hypothetical protein